jgi:histone-lysine N-methyltransferase SETMAR
MNASRYCKKIRKMHAKLAQKQPALVNRKGTVLLHDNAKPYTARETKELLKELNYTVFDHPPYSPDLSPTDYHFFFPFRIICSTKEVYNFTAGQKGLQLFCQAWWLKIL